MYIIYNGINSNALKADIHIGNIKFSVTPGYRQNLKVNESNDGDVNYTTYNSSGRMLANNREVTASIIISRKTVYRNGITVFKSESELRSDISEVVNWLKSDDYKSLVLGNMEDMEWEAIASVDTEKPDFYADGVIINVVFKCRPFTKKYKSTEIYLGSDISTDSAIVVYGESPYEVEVVNNIDTLIPYKGTAVSNPKITIGSPNNKATSKNSSITISINNRDIIIDIGSNKQFYCEIDTKNYLIYVNDILSNDKTHIGKAMPYLDGGQNTLRANGFSGLLKIDYIEYFDFTYMGV